LAFIKPISPSTPPTPSTVNWKVLTNNNIGFTLKYPTELILDYKDNLPGPLTGNIKLIQTMSEPEHSYEGVLKIFNGISIYYISSVSESDFTNYIDRDLIAISKKYSLDFYPKKKTTEMFGNVQAYEADFAANWILYYLLVPNKQGVLVISKANLSYATNPYWITLNNVLSTFKFKQ
jgi:hypothetical protein